MKKRKMSRCQEPEVLAINPPPQKKTLASGGVVEGESGELGMSLECDSPKEEVVVAQTREVAARMEKGQEMRWHELTCVFMCRSPNPQDQSVILFGNR